MFANIASFGVSGVVDWLDELAEVWRVKARERRYAQAFRERHYDLGADLLGRRKSIDSARLIAADLSGSAFSR